MGFDYDTIIAGAGPAGSAAAIGSLRWHNSYGHPKVLLLDHQPPGRGKVCGDGLGNDAIAELETLLGTFETDDLLASNYINRFQLVSPGGVIAEGTLNEPAAVCRRTKLDRTLLERSIELGATFEQVGIKRVQYEPERIRVTLTDGQTLTAAYLIGADGANSVVRRELGVSPNRGQDMAVAIRGYVPTDRCLPMSIKLDTPEVGDDKGLMGYAWAFPAGEDDAGTMWVNIGYGIAVNTSVSRDFLLERLRFFYPDLAAALTSPQGHLLPFTTNEPVYVPPAGFGRVLLAGDAASLVNPLSGEGIYYALLSGRVAGETVNAWAYNCAKTRNTPHISAFEYEQKMLQLLGKHHRQSNLLARRVMNNPGALDQIVDVVANQPAVFQDVIDIVLGRGTITRRVASAALAIKAKKLFARLG